MKGFIIRRFCCPSRSDLWRAPRQTPPLNWRRQYGHFYFDEAQHATLPAATEIQIAINHTLSRRGSFLADVTKDFNLDTILDDAKNWAIFMLVKN